MSQSGQRFDGIARHVPWLALLSSCAGLLASALPASSLLAFTRRGLHQAQLWRLWTGHFVHYGSAHLWGDLLAFAIWAALVEGESRRVLGATLLVGAPLLSCMFAWVHPEVSQYRGLSALDAALVVELIVLRGFRGSADDGGPRRGVGPWLTRQLGSSWLQGIGVVSLCLSVAKMGYEFSAGHALLAPDLGPGVMLLPSAHGFGALLGLAISLLVGRSHWRGTRLSPV